MQIRLFGGVSAVGDRGEAIAVGPAKCQAVLAALALSPGSAVPVWRLVDVVWGERPPRTAERTLQSYVTRLRKSLGSRSLVRAGGAYRLDLPVDAVDVGRFERELDVGNVEAALAEWTGAPLAGLEAPGLRGAVDALTERWLGAVELDLERRLEADAPAVIGPLTELTAHHPFREGFWALLMTALYRVGRQADALAAYRTARAKLVEQLGIEPGPRLRDLEARILGQDALLGGPAGADGPAALPTGVVTFAVAEVEGSARLWAADRAAAASTMRRVDQLADAAAGRHRGHLFAAAGDSFGAAFERPGDAAAFAADLQAAARREPWPVGAEARLRIGLHTGESEARRIGYQGPAVDLVARLASAGHGGQILVSAAAAALLDRDDLRDLGPHRLAGAVVEQRVLQLGDERHPPLNCEGRPGNLPWAHGRLIGRDRDLATVGEVLAGSPVVTLLGPGGIGKTRLALEAARQADAPAWLIELAELRAPAEIPGAIAEALGVKERQGRTLTASIVSALRQRRALLVLDNCEHVLDGAAGLAAAVAEGCPDVRVLATSREALGVRGERVLEVAPLAPAGAGAELFRDRAAAASSAFDPRADRGAVEEICRRLDGIPLAIELAAARMRSLSPGDLLARLDDRLRLLGGGPRDGAARQRTLRATVQWSYDLLGPGERAVFRRLAAFPGPFDLAAAEIVAADDEIDAVDVARLLAGLVDRSMVMVDSGPLGRRFRMLETMRRFAAEQLDAEAAAALARRHARWCRDEAARIGALLAGPSEIEGAARLQELWPSLRVAVDQACEAGDREGALALVRPIATEVLLRSRQEVGDWIERILALAEPGDRETVAFALTWAARRYALSQDRDGYLRLAERHGEPDDVVVRHARAFAAEDYAARIELAPPAAAELRRRGERLPAELVDIDVGASLLNLGRFEECDAHVAALADRYRAGGPPTCLNWSLMLLGYSAMLRGEHDLAQRRFDAALAVDVPERTYSPNGPIKARAAFRRGDHARAFRMLREHIDELLDADNMHAASIDCVEFINMMAALDRRGDAARMLGYLETTGLLDAPAWRTLVADAAARVAAGSPGPPERAAGRMLADRQALHHMRDVLDRLTADLGGEAAARTS